MVARMVSTPPHFDAFVSHPDDAVTAYSYLHTSETSMRDLAELLFRGLLCVRLWNGHLEATAALALPEPV